MPRKKDDSPKGSRAPKKSSTKPAPKTDPEPLEVPQLSNTPEELPAQVRESDEPEVGEERSAAEKVEEGAPFPVVGIGASAGGLEASRDLLSGLPPDTGMAFVFVHHLSAEHESLLVDILARSTQMPVEFASDGSRLQPNHVYVNPPTSRLALFHGTINLLPPAPSSIIRTSIDDFFRSLSEDQRRLAVGVVLSGTGSDGTSGARAIKAEGGIVMAQDPKSAAYDGMPRSVIDTGVVDVVLPAREIAAELARIARHPYLKEREPLGRQLRRDEEAEVLDKIFVRLRDTMGVDFTDYKPTTVRRRIARRMVVHKIDDLREYMNYLNDNTEEVELLYQDLLINVTGFFREPDSFSALAQEVFPRMLEGKKQSDSVRVWVPGCSTGEEAYSIAISLFEYLEKQPIKPQVQIFATDVSETSIEKARAGLFPESIAGEIGSERLAKFFVSTEGGYQVAKAIRDVCIFAKHDVTKDPPFSRLDLISCRNLLIYLGSVLQRKLIPVFHYALQPTGFLFLGSSESVGEYNNLFTLLDSKYKIFAKKPVAARPPIEFGFRQYPLTPLSQNPRSTITSSASPLVTVQKEAERIAGNRFIPPGVLVDSDMNILQFRGDTSAFLRHAPGKASLNLMEMVPEGVRSTLRSKLMKGEVKDLVPIHADGVRIRQSGVDRETDLEIVPFNVGPAERHYLIFFKEPQPSPPAEIKRDGKNVSQGAAEKELNQLRAEVIQLREQLRSTVEEKDASLEELRAANEEIQSSNEELQSINEELETAKEELQSTNEELTTLNEELQNRNFELLSINDDLRNVLTSVNIPIIILGKDLRIRRYTPMAERVLSLIPTDIGRPITDLKLKIDVPDLESLLKEVLQTLAVLEREVQDETGRWYRLQIRPYRTVEDRIDGVVIALVDIDEIRAAACKDKA